MLWKLMVAGGLWLDAVSLFRWLRRNKTGHGPGGMPGVGWALYAAGCWWGGGVLLLIPLTAVHWVCQFYVPMRHRRWLSSDRGPSLLGGGR